MFINMPEVEMADRMCGGHKQISQTLRNIYDCQRSGALRATADGVTGNPVLRVNMTISSTPYAARMFYKKDLFNGTFGRMVFSYKPRQGRDGHIPRQGTYPKEFYEKLATYLRRLDSCKGRFEIQQLNRLIDKLAADMAKLADLTDDDVLWDISKRSLVSAWKAGCVLDTQRTGVGADDRARGGVARLSRPVVEDAGLRRPARAGHQHKRGSATRTEESARRPARFVQRGPARGAPLIDRQGQRGHKKHRYASGSIAASSPTRPKRGSTPRRRSI